MHSGDETASLGSSRCTDSEVSDVDTRSEMTTNSTEIGSFSTLPSIGSASVSEGRRKKKTESSERIRGATPYHDLSQVPGETQLAKASKNSGEYAEIISSIPSERIAEACVSNAGGGGTYSEFLSDVPGEGEGGEGNYFEVLGDIPSETPAQARVKLASPHSSQQSVETNSSKNKKKKKNKKENNEKKETYEKNEKSSKSSKSKSDKDESSKEGEKSRKKKAKKSDTTDSSTDSMSVLSASSANTDKAAQASPASPAQKARKKKDGKKSKGGKEKKKGGKKEAAVETGPVANAAEGYFDLGNIPESILSTSDVAPSVISSGPANSVTYADISVPTEVAGAPSAAAAQKPSGPVFDGGEESGTMTAGPSAPIVESFARLASSGQLSTMSARTVPVLQEYIDVDEAIELAVGSQGGALAHANPAAVAAASPVSSPVPVRPSQQQQQQQQQAAFQAQMTTSGHLSPLLNGRVVGSSSDTGDTSSEGQDALSIVSEDNPAGAAEHAMQPLPVFKDLGKKNRRKNSSERFGRDSRSSTGSSMTSSRGSRMTSSSDNICIADLEEAREPDHLWQMLLGERKDVAVSMDFFRDRVSARLGIQKTHHFFEVVNAFFDAQVSRLEICSLLAWAGVKSPKSQLGRVRTFVMTKGFYSVMTENVARQWLRECPSSTPTYLLRFRNESMDSMVLMVSSRGTVRCTDIDLVPRSFGFRVMIEGQQISADVLGDAIAMCLVQDARPLDCAVARHPCFAGAMRSDDAVSKLMHQPIKAFLMRFSSAGGLAASVISSDMSILHIRIKMHPDGRLTEVDSGDTFESIEAMIMKNKLVPVPVNRVGRVYHAVRG